MHVSPKEDEEKERKSHSPLWCRTNRRACIITLRCLYNVTFFIASDWEMPNYNEITQNYTS